MKYTIREQALAQKLYEAAMAAGKSMPGVVAVAIGLSRPDRPQVVKRNITPAEFLAEARRQLFREKPEREEIRGKAFP